MKFVKVTLGYTNNVYELIEDMELLKLVKQYINDHIPFEYSGQLLMGFLHNDVEYTILKQRRVVLVLKELEFEECFSLTEDGSV